MDEGLRVISWVFGLSGLALITFLFWGAGFWPFSVLILAFLFPPYARAPENYSVVFGLMIVYGLVELIVAWGLRREMKWSRIAIVCLAGTWIGYAIWDSFTIHPPVYQSDHGYYYFNPFSIAAAVYYALLAVYVLRAKIALTLMSPRHRLVRGARFPHSGLLS